MAAVPPLPDQAALDIIEEARQSLVAYAIWLGHGPEVAAAWWPAGAGPQPADHDSVNMDDADVQFSDAGSDYSIDTFAGSLDPVAEEPETKPVHSSDNEDDDSKDEDFGPNLTWASGVISSIGLWHEMSGEEIDKCIPVFSSTGNIMPGVTRILKDLQVMTITIRDLRGPAKRLAQFQQFLSPHFLVVRAFRMYKKVPPLNNGEQMAIPANDLGAEKATIAQLLVGDIVLGWEWGMVKDAHLCYRLFLVSERLATRAMAKLPAAGGSRTNRAKSLARKEIMDAMYPDVMTARERAARDRALQLRLLYGEDLKNLVRYMAEQMPDDPDCAIAILAIFPMEHLVMHTTDVSSMKNLRRHQRRYGLWLATRADLRDFVVALCRYIGIYIRRGVVLDRLCRQPVIPGHLQPADESDRFRAGLNRLLFDADLREIQQWVYVTDPNPIDISVYRHAGVAELDPVKWSTLSGNRTIRREFRVTADLINKVGDVDKMLTESEAACAVVAMFPGDLPCGITTATDIRSAAGPPDIHDHYMWLVFKTVPAHDQHREPYLSLALVLTTRDPDDHTIAKVDACIINPLSPNCGHVLGQWDSLVHHWARNLPGDIPKRCEDGFGAPCQLDNKGVYSVGAVLLHAVSIMNNAFLWKRKLDRKWSTLIRTAAMHALHAHRYIDSYDDSGGEDGNLTADGALELRTRLK